MSSTTYPLVQSGSFEAGSTVNFHFHNISLGINEFRRNVTGTSSASSDTSPVYIHGLPVNEVVASSSMRLESNSTYALGQASTMGTPGIVMHPTEWTIRKRWPLFDVTGTGDSSKQWTNGLPVTTCAVRGIATNDLGGNFDDRSVTVGMVIDDFGTLAGTAALDQKNIAANFKSGGPVPVSFSFAYTGEASAWTPTGTNYTWLFPTTAANALTGNPVRGTLALDIDTDTNISNAALLYDVTIHCSPRTGGDHRVTCRFRFD